MLIDVPVAGLLRNNSPPSSPEENNDCKFTAAATFPVEYNVEPLIVPVVLNVVPSNVKLPSPFNVPFPLAVITLVSPSFVITGVIFDAVKALIA